MKILAAYWSDTHTDESPKGRIKVMVWPDSAMVRSGKPVFLAEGRNSLMTGIAARIDSVGKTIKKKYAKKYYSEIAPMAFLLKKDIAFLISKGKDPGGSDIVADYSVICGDFKPLDSIELSPDGEISLELNLSSLKTISLDEVKFHKDKFKAESLLSETIETTSMDNTLKTGDIVAYIHPFFHTVSPDTLLRISLGGNYSLENKLK